MLKLSIQINLFAGDPTKILVANDMTVSFYCSCESFAERENKAGNSILFDLNCFILIDFKIS